MRTPCSLRRWLVFNTVGLVGVGVQLLALAAGTELLRLDYRVATALAVEAAILHNFAWHECWTWRDRGRGRRWMRLLQFNAVSGTVSITANVVLTALYVTMLGIHYLLANMAAIASCSLVSFLANDRLVFHARNDRPASALAAAHAGRRTGR